MLIKWREAWARRQNNALRGRGHNARRDHRSLAAQKVSALSRGDHVRAVALERLPELHVGPKVRKAVRERPPLSKDKIAGPVRRRPAGNKERRKVVYTELDEGSRADFNVSRIQQNAGRFGFAAAKAQRHITRLKTRQVYYASRIRDSEAIGAAREDRASAWERTLHARKRAAQVQWLIVQLDRLFFELLSLRENQLVRFTVWSNRPRSLRKGTSRQHGRSRLAFSAFDDQG
ncbi:MobA/MobL family protein [Bradyrhizobium canariense]|nr:MobA/MobL family protein [Bradyrhizobium canariense]